VPVGGGERADDAAVVFNGGPRALYRSGGGWSVLGDLGIRPRGRRAPTRGGAVLVDGRLEVLPAGPWSMLRTGLVPGSAKGALLARLAAVVTGRVRAGAPDEPATDWIRAVAGRPELVGPLTALVRVATYAGDLDRLSADAASRQLHLALARGVLYLDEGWDQLVQALLGAARDAGVQFRTGEPVRSVSSVPRPDGPAVSVGDEVVRAGAVVLAPGSPAVAGRLLGRGDAWQDRLGPVATAACLELAVRGRPRPRFVAGADEPLYLSEHAPPARLAPDGIRVVHLLRYGARTSAEDRADLEALARRAGITDDDVVARRFLHRMVVNPAQPSPSTGGLPGRPDIGDAGMDGVLLAGDWVGPDGLLADAALVSGARAGAEAAAQAGLARSRQGSDRPADRAGMRP
jgi:phytoene dehydrogenase-like protein